MAQSAWVGFEITLGKSCNEKKLPTRRSTVGRVLAHALTDALFGSDSLPLPRNVRSFWVLPGLKKRALFKFYFNYLK